jgi:hypothetical protein
MAHSRFSPAIRPGKGIQPEASLCYPDGEKTCFACCPPIRPSGYEHLQHQNIVKRILRENTRAFTLEDESIRPITGFGCWALGYLDPRCTLVGCLLHPARNEGVDLRRRVAYGNKCRREGCLEAGTFQELAPAEKRFWLHLSDGLNSFCYSSRSRNPIFRMLGWGVNALRVTAHHTEGTALSRKTFFQTYPFFGTTLHPAGHAYLLYQAIKDGRAGLLQARSFRPAFERFARRLAARVRAETPRPVNAPYTHRLDLDYHFLYFLRLSAGIKRITEGRAWRLKELVDQAVREFVALREGQT